MALDWSIEQQRITSLKENQSGHLYGLVPECGWGREAGGCLIIMGAENADAVLTKFQKMW